MDAVDVMSPCRFSTRRRTLARESCPGPVQHKTRPERWPGKVNSSGRKAFRRLGNKALVEAFKYHHLVGKPSETATEPSEEPAVPPGS